MSFVTEILKRPTIKNVTNFLLYGTPDEDSKSISYQMRLKNAYTRCDKALSQYDADKDSTLYRAVNELLSEHEKVYMEIGFRSGLIFMQDALDQTKFIGEEKE